MKLTSKRVFEIALRRFRLEGCRARRYSWIFVDEKEVI